MRRRERRRRVGVREVPQRVACALVGKVEGRLFCRDVGDHDEQKWILRQQAQRAARTVERRRVVPQLGAGARGELVCFPQDDRAGIALDKRVGQIAFRARLGLRPTRRETPSRSAGSSISSKIVSVDRRAPRALSVS